MPEDYYADAAAPEPSMPEQEKESAEGESDSATAVIPQAVLGGKKWKPGDEIMLEIVQLTEGGAVVKYASEKGGEGYEEEPAAETAPESGGGGNPGSMSSMMY